MRLVTLGRLQLEPDAYPRPKLLLLIAYLALEGGRTRDHLRTLFWPQATDASASLRVALAQLRADLPGIVETTEALVSTGIACDAVALLEAFERSDLARTVALYQGAFLEGVTSEWGVELEEWVLNTREFLAGRVVEAHLRQAEEALAFGETETVERHAIAARHVPGAAPADPDTLVRLHHVFASIKHPLASDLRREADELGLTLQRPQAAVQASVAPTNLPAPLDAFVARHDERRHLSELLGQAEARLVTVTGPGGVGKSRLALEVTRELHRAGRFADGVFVVFLEAQASPEAAVAEILRVLQVIPRADEDPRARLAERLRSSELLLLLDNFEHLMAYAVQLETLLAACPKLKLLVTSREPLRLAAEWLFRLEGLPVPALAESDPAAPQHAIELFVRRARRVISGFSLEVNHHEVLEICRIVQGFPLGIVLAAALIHAMPLPALAEALGQHLDVLEGAIREPSERHQGIRAVFEHSWRLLNPTEQRALIRMAVFRDGGTRQAVTHVTEANLTTLIALTDKSLLQLSADGRYRVHPLLAQYCTERLVADPTEERIALARHAQYYLEWLGSLLTLLRGPEAQHGLERIETDIENLRSAWMHRLNTGEVDGLGELVDLVLFFDRRGRVREGLELFQRTVAVLESDVSQDTKRSGMLAGYLVNLAWLHYCLGQLQPAQERAEQAATLARNLGPSGQVTLSKAFNTLGNIAKASNDLEGAIHYAREALACARNLNDHAREVLCLENLAIAENLLGQTQMAKAHYAEAMHMAEEIGDLTSITSIKLSLGLLLLHDPAESDAVGCREVLESGLELAVHERLLSLEPHFHINLSAYFLQVDDAQQARYHAEQALRLARSIAEPVVETEALLSIGLVMHAEGNLSAALHHYQTSLHQARALQDSVLELEVLLALARLNMNTGDFQAAYGALIQVYREAAVQSWHRREAIQLAAESNLDLDAAFGAGD